MVSMIFNIIKSVAVSFGELFPLSGNGFYQLFSVFKSTYIGADNEIWYIIFADLGVLAALLVIFKDSILKLVKSLLKIIKQFINKEKIEKGESEQELLIFAMGGLPVLLWPLLRYVFGFMNGSSLLLVIAFVLSGLILTATDKVKRANTDLMKLRGTDSLIAGVFRLLGFIPGITGTGGMIFAGLLSGFSEKLVFNYAFIIAVPLFLGKLIINIFPALNLPLNLWDVIGCIITLAGSFAATYYMTGLFEKMLTARKLKIFSYILYGAAFVSLILWMRG